MLHEILLSLSGIQSPIWDQARDVTNPEGHQLNNYVSPPERAMLASLDHLQKLHVLIKDTSARITASHPSMICRAISASVTNVQLGRFMNKIIEVESSILRKDAAYVGGYGIVPLSTLVAEFAPWTRRLEWLSNIVQRLDHQHHQNRSSQMPSGALALNLLRSEIHTGYSDIEEMATDLLSVGQRAWLRAAALWILYGKLPISGADDFGIKLNPSATSNIDAFVVEESLLPDFVTEDAGHALLSIGSALNQLQTQVSTSSLAFKGLGDPSAVLLPGHLELLEGLQYPLNPALFGNVLKTINYSISENALSQILPLPTVLQLLHVILRYVLLDNGEFAVSLIAHADERVTSRQHIQSSSSRPIRKLGRLDDLVVKETELNGIINKSFTELDALSGDEELDDEVFDLARKLLSLKQCDSRREQHLISTLLPTPTLLHLTLPPSSPLHIFLSAHDVQTYAFISAYLLSLHRAGLHLSALWKISPLRRCHPTPLGPPRSASRAGQETLASRRSRDFRRNRATCRHWTTASKTLFLVNELKGYLQGEVIQSSWRHFHSWMIDSSTKGDLSSAKTSRPATSSSIGVPPKSADLSNGTGTNSSTLRPSSDPRALAEAHQRYLSALKTAMFLNKADFLETLKILLAQIDHFVALFSRLQAVWEGLDLQEDEGVMDAFSNYAQDERDVLGEMDTTSEAIEASLIETVDKVRDVDRDSRIGPGVTSVIESLSGVELNGKKFVPWRARTVDRLLMKLDGLTGRQDEERYGSGNISENDDE